MNAKSTIRKLLFIVLWICIGGGMLGLLLAAIGTKNKGTCKAYQISLRGSENRSFIGKKEVEDLLLKASKSNIIGQPISNVNLHQLEQLLEHNSWIEHAELYFDNRNVLHVSVSQKRPVARIFTISGESFFMDSLGRMIPLSGKSAIKLPVFTGFPSTKLNRVDSNLIAEVRVIANHISNDSFWFAQTAQVDITADRKFELIPMIGNHIVRLGDASDIERKLNRLFVFYREVLSKTGFDKYKTIDVQYKGQVVASRSEGNHRVDPIQLRRNVEKLLKQSIEAEKDTVIKYLPVITSDEETTATKGPVPEQKSNSGKTAVNTSTKTQKTKITPVKAGKVTGPKTPKAVMPKRIPEEPNGGYN